MIFNNSKYNSHWPTKRLDELGDFNRGKSRHRPRNDKRLFENGEYPLIQTGDVKAANIYLENHSDCYNEFGLNQSKLWPEGTLCITIAANIAETALLRYPMCFPDSVVGFNAFEDECSEVFMHYIFTYIKQTIQDRIQGSIQDNINIEYLTGLSFKIPVKSERDKIEAILFDLDSKISLNNRINQELEAMAKLIYDYWFVQFDFPDENGKPYKSSGGKMVYNKQLKREIPEGWGAGMLNGLFEVNPKLSIKKGQVASYIDMNALPESGFMTKKVQKKVFGGGMKFQNGDLAVARITPCLENGKTGLISLLEEDEIGFGSTEFIILRGIERDLRSFACFLSRSDKFRKYAISKMTGTSGRKRVKADALEQFELAIPPKTLMNIFEHKVRPFFDRMTAGTKENQKLSELRDWLLPLLMNGQVTIKETKEYVESEVDIPVAAEEGGGYG